MGYALKLATDGAACLVQNIGRDAVIKRAILALVLVLSTLGLVNNAQAQSAPAWGYDTWGGTFTFGGSCPGGNTHTFGDTTASGAGEQVLAMARSCVPYTYNNLNCTQTAVTSSVTSGTSTCTFGGDFPGSFGLGITCSPGKVLTPALPATCDGSTVTSVSLSNPGSGATAPANITLTATASNPTYPITHVKFYNGSTYIGTGLLTAGTVTSGTYVTNAWTNIAAGTYSLTAKATDDNGGGYDQQRGIGDGRRLFRRGHRAVLHQHRPSEHAAGDRKPEPEDGVEVGCGGGVWG